MTSQSKGVIFLADERSVSNESGCETMHALRSQRSSNPHKRSVGFLYGVNDTILDGNSYTTLVAEKAGWLLLLPVSGAIAISDGLEPRRLLAAGQVAILAVKETVRIEIINPFKSYAVNFLHIWIGGTHEPGRFHETITYDVNGSIGQLVDVLAFSEMKSELPFKFSIGKFMGRQEAVYQGRFKPAAFFCFAISGAFEAEGRLLHPGDALSLSDIDGFELEALSNEAIMMIIEVPAMDNA